MSCCFITCNDTLKQATGKGEKHEFFPVRDFLEGQVYLMDSLKLPAYKYNTVDNISESVLLAPGEFKALAQEFMNPDINDPAIKGFYKETSFADQSIPNVTFTYSTQKRDLPLQRMDVIIRPDLVLNDQVQSIYLEKVSNNGDTVTVKKLYWKTGESFQIISRLQPGSQPATVSQLKVTWSAD